MSKRSVIVLTAFLGALNMSGTAAAGGGWEFLFDWGDFGDVEDIAVDSNGSVYVLDRPNGRVQVFTPDGQYLREQTGFNDPTGLAIDADTVYVQERCGVYRFTTNFVDLGGWESCIGKGDLQQNRGIDVKNGVAWIVTVNDVLKFTTDGTLLDRFMDFIGWIDVRAVPDGSIWVVTGFGFQGLVRHYSEDGQVITEWNTILPGEKSSAPVAIALDSSGTVFTADGRVKMFSPNGVLQDLIEVPFALLLDVELAGDDILYVGQSFTSPGRVLKYRRVPMPVESETWGSIKARYR